MIETDGLTKQFGDVVAVDHVSMKIRDGELFGLLGPNGAGKTTTVRMLAGLISKTSGTARIGDLEVGRPSDALAIRKMIGFLPENVGLYEELSAEENLDFFGRLYEIPDAERGASIERLLRELDLWGRRAAPVGTFSKGMKQKLAIARALVHDPKVLFLDEPTANLDPEATKTVREVLVGLKKENRTIVLTTHNLDEAQRVCDRVAIVRQKVLAVGAPNELKSGIAGRATVVRLESVTEEMARSVRERLGGRKVDLEPTSLVVEVNDPEKENPEIVDAIVRAGGRIREVQIRMPSLEDVYLSEVRR